MMIATFDDLCLAMYVLVADAWTEIGPQLRRPGPAPACSDAELVTMVLVGECLSEEVETHLVARFQARPDLFPVVPERSWFHRRRRALAEATNAVRRVLLRHLDLAWDQQCALDSLPVEVLPFARVPGSPTASTWKSYGARYGWVAAKKRRIFGFKLQLLVTLGGVILDFALAPANASDLSVGADLVAAHPNHLVVADKGYVSAPIAQALADECDVILLTTPRRNQQRQLSPSQARLQRRWRAIVETVNSQLAEQFGIERTRARTFWSFVARLHAKLAAHTAAILLNRLAAYPFPLHLRRFAFLY